MSCTLWCPALCSALSITYISLSPTLSQLFGEPDADEDVSPETETAEETGALGDEEMNDETNHRVEGVCNPQIIFT